MAQHQAARSRTQASAAEIVIPDKLYFRIVDVARLCGLPAYVLRFWETEFPQLHPNKGGTGQRLYRRRDVEVVIEIKRLLYEEGFTIAGARRVLGEKRRHANEIPARAKTEETGSSGGATQSTSESRGATPALAKPHSAKKSAADIQALRAEMQNLLAMLGSGTTGEKAAAPALHGAKTEKPASKSEKRSARRTRVQDEPTLF
jgi:DNA-binding transcriptional MerR regulator